LKNQRIEHCFQKTKIWDINDSKSKEIDSRIAEMIVMDDLPFSHVEDVGFMRLIGETSPLYKIKQRHYYENIVYNKMFPSVTEEVQSVLESIKKNKLSFTTDAWSDTSAGVSLLSLTCHGINDNYERVNLVLAAEPLSERHTGEYLSQKFDEMIQNWKLENSIHIVMRDSGANIKKALFLSGVNNLDCTAHKLQLVVKAGLSSQKSVIDVISKVRAVATHFHHSTMAQDELRKIQTRLDKPHLCIIHDVVTRWNSTLHMLQRIMVVREELCLYSTSNSKVRQLTNADFQIIENSIKLLKPFDEVTKTLSFRSSSLSQVTPLIKSLKNLLEPKNNDDYEGVKGMLATIRSEINRRFEGLEVNFLYSVATYLDPRYKGKFFSSQSVLQQVQAEVVRLCNEICSDTEPKSVERPSKRSKVSHIDQSLPSTSATKTIFESMNEFLSSSSDDDTQIEINKKSLIMLEKYQKEKRIAQDEDPLTWWKSNEETFKKLSVLARKYLSCPSSSIPSEQLFSGAGTLYDEKRNRLTGKNAEKLIFLKFTIPVIKFKYKRD
jgi:hypothetical protein